MQCRYCVRIFSITRALRDTSRRRSESRGDSPHGSSAKRCPATMPFPASTHWPEGQFRVNPARLRTVAPAGRRLRPHGSQAPAYVSVSTAQPSATIDAKWPRFGTAYSALRRPMTCAGRSRSFLGIGFGLDRLRRTPAAAIISHPTGRISQAQTEIITDSSGFSDQPGTAGGPSGASYPFSPFERTPGAAPMIPSLHHRSRRQIAAAVADIGAHARQEDGSVSDKQLAVTASCLEGTPPRAIIADQSSG
jgi:hypothetical protein